MDKLNFTKEQIARLKEICNEREEIVIDGMTSRGRAFNVTGRIAFDDNGKFGVSKDWVAIEFGKANGDVSEHDVLAIYYLNIVQNELSPSLLINSIKTANDEMIYDISKENLKEMLEIVDKENVKISKRIEETPIVKYDRVSNKMFDLVGQPVSVYTNNEEVAKGVLLEIEKANVFGNATFSVAHGTEITTAQVEAETTLMELNDKGEWTQTVANDRFEHLICAKANQKACKTEVNTFDM